MDTAAKTDTKPDPALIVVRGIPGGGKSYVAANVQKLLGKEKTVVLDPDAIDTQSQEYTDLSRALRSEGVDPKLYPYRFLRQKAYDAIKNHKIIIWNQAFIDFDGLKKTIARLQAFATEQDTKLRILIVEVEIDETVARKRVSERARHGGHDVPDDAFARFVERYKSFAGNGYPTVAVRGEHDAEQSAPLVVKALGAQQKEA